MYWMAEEYGDPKSRTKISSKRLKYLQNGRRDLKSYALCSDSKRNDNPSERTFGVCLCCFMCDYSSLLSVMPRITFESPPPPMRYQMLANDWKPFRTTYKTFKTGWKPANMNCCLTINQPTKWNELLKYRKSGIHSTKICNWICKYFHMAYGQTRTHTQRHTCIGGEIDFTS